jgi:hypothetical protein
MGKIQCKSFSIWPDARLVLVAQTSVCGVPLELAEILDLCEFSVVCGPSILALGNSPGLLTEPHRLKPVLLVLIIRNL